MNSNSTHTLEEQKVYVNEIVFYSRSEVSLFGFLERSGTFHETQYVIDRKNLQLLLSQSKEGIEVLWQIEKLFVLPHQVPASINLIDLFGTTQVFEAGSIQLDAPCYRDESDEIRATDRTDLFFVQAVRPFPSARKSSL